MTLVGTMIATAWLARCKSSDDASPLVGDAEVTADFATDEMDGRLDNFEGRVQGGGAQDFDGQITLSEGDIGIVIGADFRADAGGVLTGGSDVSGVNGSIVGAFFNDDGRDVAAVSAATTNDTAFTFDDDVAEGGTTVTGER